MSAAPRNLTLERVNRLMQAVADLTESHAAQGRIMARLLTQMNANLETLTKEVRDVAAEQILLGNRIEEALVRAMRANIRLDEKEDAES